MAMAFEYYLDTDYEFNTDFQKKLAECCLRNIWSISMIRI